MRQGWLSNVTPKTTPKDAGLTGFLGRDMAVDLGTANTLVYVRGRGIVLNEPSVVAVNTVNGSILAVGAEAKRMIGRTPAHIRAVRTLKDGVIADFDITEKMLRYFIQKVHHRRWLAKPRVVICVPSGITGVEQRAVGSAFPSHEDMIAEIKGRDLVTGLPRTIHIRAEEVRKAIEEPVNNIIDAVKNTLDRCPPELAADVMDKGMVLTGGGALLKGLDERLKHETGMPIHVAETPLSCVAIGSGKCLEEFEVLKRVLISSTRS